MSCTCRKLKFGIAILLVVLGTYSLINFIIREVEAAETDDENAQCMIGYLFENGTGCEVDVVQAMTWFQKSAAQGLQRAIDDVERLHVLGYPRY